MRISLDMLKAGYEAGAVRLIESPNGDGVVCGIGDDWFYFGGHEAADRSVDEYRRDFSFEEIVGEIFETLEAFRKDEDTFEDEYLYFYHYLNEGLQGVVLDNNQELMEQDTEIVDRDGLYYQALQFVRENRDLAYEIFRVIDKEYYKEDILSKLEVRSNVSIEDLSDEEISKMVDRFDDILHDNEAYFDAYWLSADAAIDEFLEEKGKKSMFSVGKEECSAIVDEALRTIRGVGVDMGSGCYELNAFVIDGEDLDLYMDVCKLEDDGEVHYAVYYAVEYVDGDTLFHDWANTSRLDADELKKVVCEIANTDFTEDIRKEMGKGNVGAVLADAEAKVGGAKASQEKSVQVEQELHF